MHTLRFDSSIFLLFFSVNPFVKTLYLFLILLMVSSNLSCAIFRNPMKSWDKADNKVQTAEAKVIAKQGEIIEQSKTYVYAMQLALQKDPATNQYHEVETILNNKAIATLGTPNMEKIVELEKMVNNLLSENQKAIEYGKKQLATLDKEVIYLQEDKAYLEAKLAAAQQKLEKVGSENAGLAQKWNTIMKVLWYALIFIIVAIVVRVLSMVLPPPYNSIAAVLSIPFTLIGKLVLSLIPDKETSLGLVSKNYKTATEDLVTVVQSLKKAHPELHSTISETVYKETDSDTSAKVINETKQKMGIVG